MLNAVADARRSVPRAHRWVLLASALCLVQPTTAIAFGNTGSMSVGATVSGTCVVQASSIGYWPTTSTDVRTNSVTGRGSVGISCTNGSRYTVALDKGSGAGATVMLRQMRSGTHLMGYWITSDASYAQHWGDGTGGTVTVPGTGSGSVQWITAYSMIPNQTVYAGDYSDIVNVTVTY